MNVKEVVFKNRIPIFIAMSFVFFILIILFVFAYPDFIAKNKEEILILCEIFSGPVIAVIALVGLYQIILSLKQIEGAKEFSRKSNMRHALELTAQQCVYFRDHIANSKLLQFRHKDKFKGETTINLHNVVKCSLNGNQITIKIENVDPAIINNYYISNNPDIIGLLNHIEAFSIYFTSGLCIDEVAFRPCATTFCQMVEAFSPVVMRFQNKDKMYVHTMTLYTRWKSLIEKEKLDEEIKNLSLKRESTETIKLNQIL